MSESVEEEAEVHPFTLDWWRRLPRTYRVQDRRQNPVLPLLRLMDGPGRIAGQMRSYNTALWDGTAVNPATAPAALLPWLAWLTGIPHNARSVPTDVLRRRVVAQLAGQQTGIGTASHIAETAREYLAPGANVQVLASGTLPWTLVVGVASEDMVMSVDAFVQRLRAAGVVPAGHALTVQDIRATWEQWEAAAGLTWAEKEAAIRRWDDSDSAGAALS